MGEEVVAFIRLNDGIKSIFHDEIIKFCKGKLSHFKVPKYTIIVDEFPRTLSGKVQKFKFINVFEDKIRKAMKVEKIKVAFES